MAESKASNRAYLERRIAYKLQELASGGLSQVTQARLEDLAAAREVALLGGLIFGPDGRGDDAAARPQGWPLLTLLRFDGHD